MQDTISAKELVKKLYKTISKDTVRINHGNFPLLLFRSRLCHYSVGGAWWHLGFYESF
jgi:hypothetical protein